MTPNWKAPGGVGSAGAVTPDVSEHYRGDGDRSTADFALKFICVPLRYGIIKRRMKGYAATAPHPATNRASAWVSHQKCHL